MRKRLFEIIETSNGDDKASSIYDVFVILTIIFSIIPLAFKNTNRFLVIVDRITVIIFIVDYVLRLITADLKLKKGVISFFIYPFSIMAIIDLFSILPSFCVISSSYKLLRLLRMFRAFRVLRAAKMLRYSKNFLIISDVIKVQRKSLSAVCMLAVAYIFVSALLIFNIEPESFESFFDAIYWATVSLTTVGYGDIYPITTAGRVITMISSIFGIAIIALPAGIITAGYMNRINQDTNEKEE